MISQELIQRHIKTFSSRDADDSNAVAKFQTFFRSGGIVADFTFNDKWPNSDGRFELVPNLTQSRLPKQSFCVQIKGTSSIPLMKG